MFVPRTRLTYPSDLSSLCKTVSFRCSVRPCQPQQPVLEMIGQTYPKSGDRDRRAGKATGRHYRTAVDEQVLNRMYSTIPVHDACSRIVRHPRRAEMMCHAAQLRVHLDLGRLQPFGLLQVPDALATQLRIEMLGNTPNGSPIEFGKAPIKLGAPLSQGIKLIR